MCKSRAEGGQRCYSHARKALDAALAERKRIEPLTLLRALGAQDAISHRTEAAIEGRIIRAQLDLASTPQGRAEYQAQAEMAHVHGDNETAARLTQLVERGQLLQERNAALSNVHRNDRWHNSAPRRGAHQMELTPDQVRENIAKVLTPDQAAGACRDLAATLLKFQRSITHRKKVGHRKDDHITQLLSGTPEGKSEHHRLHHQWIAFLEAEQRLLTITSTPGMEDSTAWREFITQTRHARDHPHDNVAFAADYRRDSNYILRVCAEIAHQQTR